MPSISHRRITSPSDIGGDGLELSDGQHWDISDCIIDLSGWSLGDIDECCGITRGSSATFRRCWIRGAGKLLLCGTGDAQDIPAETGQHVEFFDCILEDGGRRFPEVQDGMRVLLHDCLVRNWGSPDRFTVRNFGAWAHAGGRIDAVGCVFWQDMFWRPWGQFWRDLGNHIGQAWNDEGLRGLLRPSTYLPGVCRGLLATAGGEAYAWHCWRNHWWIALPWRHTTAMMDDAEALELVRELESMAERLDAELPVAP